MDKQLRENMQSALRKLILVSRALAQLPKDSPEEADKLIGSCLNELESYINDNYVSKDKVRGLKKDETGYPTEQVAWSICDSPDMTKGSKIRNLYAMIKQIQDAIDTLVSVPTPES